MKKSARRTLSLVLTLVLICALAATAFAEAKTAFNEVETPGGNFVVMDASISQYSVSGQIYVNDGQLMDYLFASVTYSYNVATLGLPPVTDTVTSSGNSVRYARASKTITSNISAMHSATFNYKAILPGESGTYIGAPIILEY